jgi:uncharacterized protein
VNIEPVLDFGDLQPGGNATAVIREAASRLGLAPEQGVKVRLTGSVALSDEEFATVADGAVLNGFITLLLVGLVLWLALRKARIILAIFVNLVFGLLYTAAIGLWMVGALNLISVAFAVLFVGLGVDFGIQFCVRYRSERHRVLLVPADRISRSFRARPDRRNRNHHRARNYIDPASGLAHGAQTTR